MSSTEASIEVRLLSVTGIRTEAGNGSAPTFDFNVKLEEAEKRTGEAVFNFAITINTKPSLAKIDLNGIVTVQGDGGALDKILQTDPETKVPYLLKRVYEQVFLSAYLLSSMINVPHPPPVLGSQLTKKIDV
jgi:hypothetical protein